MPYALVTTGLAIWDDQIVIAGGEDRPSHRSAHVMASRSPKKAGEPMSETNFIDYLKTVDSPTVSNAIELLKVRPPREGFVPLSVRSLFPEFGRMVGYAVTAQVETVTECYPTSLDLFVDLYRLVGESPKPAVVAFQEIGGYPDYAAHCGEVMATFSSARGPSGWFPIAPCATSRKCAPWDSSILPAAP